MSDPPVIRTARLTKVFGQRRAVDELALTVAPRRVFGLLGENGAGKSTTIRMLLGLSRPTYGAVELFGEPLASRRKAILPRVGALVEGPAFYPYLSGQQNLELFGRLSGGVPAARIQAVLDRVGLGDRGQDLYRGYSTGMRQRLGIGAALLHDPELIVLDEPLNGLDPPAVLLVRELIKSLCRDEGKTILVSSHLLQEVEASCDEVAIMSRGKLVTQGRVDELLKPTHARLELSLRAADQREQALETARALAGVVSASPDPGRAEALVCELDDGTDGADLNRALVEAGLDVATVVPHRRTLEELFHELTQGPPPGQDGQDGPDGRGQAA